MTSKIIKVKTQEEFDREINAGNTNFYIIGFTAVLRGNSHDELFNSSHAVLWGNSHAELLENSLERSRGHNKGSMEPVEKVMTPEKRTVEEVTQFLNVSPQHLLKTLIFESDKGCVAVLVRGDHEISDKKLKAVWGSVNIRLASEETVERITHAPKGFAGPIGLSVPILADLDIQEMVNFVTGAMKEMPISSM